MRRRLAVAAAGLAALTLLSACDLVSHGCTQKGGYSGVLFEDVGAVLPMPTPTEMPTPTARSESAAPSPEPADGPIYRAVGCADGVCAELQGARRDELMWLHVVLNHVTEPTSVTATLTVTEVETGDVVFAVSTPVDLVEWQPNGPRCPPIVFRARLRPSPDGELVPVSNNA